MPIEIRPSDVMFGLGKVLQQGSNLVADIRTKEEEKARVKQVNDGLILSEMARQKDYESYKNPNKVVEVEVGAEGPGGGPVLSGEREYKALGDVPQNVIEEELRKQQAALEEQIRLTTPNKRAREELIARSKMAAIGHRDKVMGQWWTAAQGVYLTGQKDYATLLTMDMETPVDGLVAKMQDRIAEGRLAGWITREVADAYMVKFEDDLQYSRAMNGALDIASQTETVEAKTMEPITPASQDERYADETGQAKGTDKPFDFKVSTPITPEQAVKNAEAYLDAIPYYQNKPEEKAKIFNVVLRKYEAMVTANDKAVDGKYALEHINAGTIEACDAALNELKTEKIYDGLVRYNWEQRFQSKKDDFLRMEAAGAKASKVKATEAGMEELKDLFWSDATTDEYLDGISTLYHAGKISDETGREWGKMTRKPEQQNAYKLQGSDAIAESYKLAIDRVKNGTSEKDKAKWRDLMTKAVKAQEQFAKEVAGKDDSNEILSIAQRHMAIDMPSQADFRVGDMDFAKKGDVAKLLTAMRDRKIPALSPTDTGKMATVVTTMLKDAYGVKPEQFIGEPWVSRMMGNAMVQVMGLEPGRPNDAFYYYVDVDEAGNLVMNTANSKMDTGPTYATTLAKKREVDMKAAVAAANKAGLTGAAAVNAVEKAVGGASLSAAELTLLPTGTIPGEIDITAPQLIQFYKWIKGKKVFTESEIAAFSTASNIAISKLKEVLKNRGLEVKP